MAQCTHASQCIHDVDELAYHHSVKPEPPRAMPYRQSARGPDISLWQGMRFDANITVPHLMPGCRLLSCMLQLSRRRWQLCWICSCGAFVCRVLVALAGLLHKQFVRFVNVHA